MSVAIPCRKCTASELVAGNIIEISNRRDASSSAVERRVSIDVWLGRVNNRQLPRLQEGDRVSITPTKIEGALRIFSA